VRWLVYARPASRRVEGIGITVYDKGNRRRFFVGGTSVVALTDRLKALEMIREPPTMLRKGTRQRVV
jgi:hypothetical protein